jgi:hypothetical protein
MAIVCLSTILKEKFILQNFKYVKAYMCFFMSK